jgi:two-component system, OmpR family, KDP operon response regulator KdpE
VKKKVLIVEDDPVQVRLLSVQVRNAGYHVAVACDGVQSVIAVRRERPDLILLDIGLPGGDGYLVLRRLKALVHLSAVPIIAVSGRAAETEGDKMLAAGADDYFQKPVDAPRLLGRIRELLGEQPLAAAS